MCESLFTVIGSTVPNLTQESFLQVKSEVGVGESNVSINLFPTDVYINQFYSIWSHSTPGVGYTETTEIFCPFKPVSVGTRVSLLCPFLQFYFRF